MVGAIVVMIFLHELGHYIAAKQSGMKVTEFFLGFGPRLWSFQRGETEYGVKAIPAGAYVRIIGMHNLDEVPPEDEPRTYRQQSYPKRLAVAPAGSAMHFLQAIVASFLVFAVLRRARARHAVHARRTTFASQSTVDGSAAAPGRRSSPATASSSIDGEQIDSFTTLARRRRAAAGQGKCRSSSAVTASTITKDVTDSARADGHGLPRRRAAGASPIATTWDPVPRQQRRTFDRARAYISKQTVRLLRRRFFSPSGLSDFADTVVNRGDTATTSCQPVRRRAPTSELRLVAPIDENRPVSILGAARFGSEIVGEGAFAFLAFFASINIFLGIFNLIPLLPLDGGHVAIATYERLRSRKGTAATTPTS